MTWLADPAEIYRRSLGTLLAEADIGHLAPEDRDIALRAAHACGMPDVAASVVCSAGAVAAGRAALAAGAPVIADCRMVAAGIIGRALGREPLVTLDRVTPEAARGTTRSAAAVDLWPTGGAVIAIGNAPTALFRLLDRLAEGAPPPALILGFPVGFVGAAEAKAALAASGHPFATLPGRRGGSAMAAAAVNALTLGPIGDGT